MKTSFTFRSRCPMGCNGSVAYCDLGMTLLSTVRQISRRLPNNVGMLTPAQMSSDVLWLQKQHNHLADAYLVHIGADNL